MIRSWTTSLRVTAGEVTLLVRDEDQGDLLKARLPRGPRHPRALLTLLEGLALWRGEPLRAVFSVVDRSDHGLASDLFGDELWPGESQLVSFYVAGHAPQRRLAGLGDFRVLRSGRRT